MLIATDARMKRRRNATSTGFERRFTTVAGRGRERDEGAGDEIGGDGGAGVGVDARGAVIATGATCGACGEGEGGGGENDGGGAAGSGTEGRAASSAAARARKTSGAAIGTVPAKGRCAVGGALVRCCSGIVFEKSGFACVGIASVPFKSAGSFTSTFVAMSTG